MTRVNSGPTTSELDGLEKVYRAKLHSRPVVSFELFYINLFKLNFSICYLFIIS
jgi:hypothetical protein